MFEAAAVLGITAGAIGAVYLLTVEKVASPWRVAATQVQNVSRAQGSRRRWQSRSTRRMQRLRGV